MYEMKCRCQASERSCRARIAIQQQSARTRRLRPCSRPQPSLPRPLDVNTTSACCGHPRTHEDTTTAARFPPDPAIGVG